MKTLRTVCFVCAGFYLMQMLGFMLSSYSIGFVRDLMPNNVDANPLFRVQENTASLMAAFAPYMLIGAVICLWMAWRVEQWWKAIPLLSVLLVAAGIIWVFAFVQQMKAFGNMIAGSFGDMPGAFSSYLEIMTRIGYWSSAAPVLLPGVLIFIFWRRAQKGALHPDNSRITSDP